MRDPRDSFDHSKANRLDSSDYAQHQDQRNIGDYDNVISLQSTGKISLRESLSARITPPPLNRQRDVPNLVTDKPGSITLPKRPPPDPSGLKRSSSGPGRFNERPVNERMGDERGFEYLRHSPSFLAPSAYRAREGRNRNILPRNSDGARSDISSITGPSSKRTCRVCEKSFATNYNPIITCPTCNRPYHDSCRKPPLIEGVDPQRWECSKCLSSNRSLTSTTSAAPRAPRASLGLPPVGGLPGRGNVGTGTYTSQRKSLPGPHITSYSDLAKSFTVPSSTKNRFFGAHLDTLSSLGKSALPDGYNNADRVSENAATTDQSLDRPSLSLNHATLPSTFDKGVHGSPGVTLKRSDDTLEWFRGLESKAHERAEVSDTPTQRSSQMNMTNSSPRQQPVYDRPIGVNDGFILSTHAQSEKKASLTVLCSVCRKQRILAKNSSDNVKCRNCQNRLLIVEAGKLEIPETPDVACSPKADARSSSQVADPAATNSPASAVKPASNHWFESKLVSSKPSVVQKEVSDDEAACTSIESHKTFNTLDSPNGVCNVADVTGQVFVRNAQGVGEASPPKKQMPVKPPHLDGQISTLSKHRPEFADVHKKSDRDRSLVLDLVTEKDVTTSSRPHDHVGPDNDSTTVAPGTNQLASAVTIPTPSLTTTRSSFTSGALADGGSASSASPATDRRYTNRELARIALVAAGASRLTALEIIDWLAQKFTHLQKGEGAWQKSIKAVLSRHPEFCGDKLAGAQSSAKRYDFVDATIKQRYQKEYREYCTSSASISPVSGNVQLGDKDGLGSKPTRKSAKEERSHPQKAVKSAPTLARALPVKPKPEARVVSTKELPSKTAKHSDPLYMPFERHTPRWPRKPLDLDQDVKRETSFCKVMLQDQKSSVETMTQADKAKRIAEITARPSRKTFFGSDYRLAHVRRYGRQDIHDESDGAWKPWFSNEDGMNSGQVRDVEMAGSKESSSLKELFDLPENAIPMNDGHTELAFRDGTLVNGKLPRPRQMYKVGKFFGGDLTVRTS